jgi:hypothetical protein
LCIQIKRRKENARVAIRRPSSGAAGDVVTALTDEGAEVIHLSPMSLAASKENPFFVKDRMKEVHLSLVEKGIRDQVTLIGGGGVAMAEHMAKLIICAPTR